jgi:hypothetical protein
MDGTTSSPKPIFTARARRLIESAVAGYANPDEQQTWRAWATANPETRLHGQPWRDVLVGSLPSDIARIAGTALNMQAHAMRLHIDSPGMMESQISEISNDLSFIRSVQDFITQVGA